MKEKRHLVMWVEFIALAVLLARRETVRIRENAKEVQEYGDMDTKTRLMVTLESNIASQA